MVQILGSKIVRVDRDIYDANINIINFENKSHKVKKKLLNKISNDQSMLHLLFRDGFIEN